MVGISVTLHAKWTSHYIKGIIWDHTARWQISSLKYQIPINLLFKCVLINTICWEGFTCRLFLLSFELFPATLEPGVRCTYTCLFDGLKEKYTCIANFYVWINNHVSNTQSTYLNCQWSYDMYRKTSNIRRTLVGNKIVDHSDVVGASPVGAAPTTSSFST